MSCVFFQMGGWVCQPLKEPGKVECRQLTPLPQAKVKAKMVDFELDFYKANCTTLLISVLHTRAGQAYFECT